ncbi:pilin [Enterovibrio sp. FF113]|uniref:pilin n=1 Tax=Enterovibrio sp. FF113 TaxID=3230010 RepID=UPI00352FDE62
MRKQKGFSLIELMIVVTVIGVLSAIALPAYQKYALKSEAAAGLATLRSLQTNITTYVADTGSFPATDKLSEIGAAADMNKLGALSTAVEAQTITFTFSSNSSSIPTDETLVMTMNTTTGLWSCLSKVTDVKLKGCPLDETTPTPTPTPPPGA